MNSLPYIEHLASLRANFETGATRPYEFRRKQLLALRQAIKEHEQAINDALHADLRKSPEETYISETGPCVCRN